MIETEVECEQAVPRKDATLAGSVLHHLHCAIDLQRLKTMTKREAAQGVNDRLSIALDQDSVAPGEIIRGVVRLGLLESIKARERESCSRRGAFTLTIGSVLN